MLGTSCNELHVIGLGSWFLDFPPAAQRYCFLWIYTNFFSAFLQKVVKMRNKAKKGKENDVIQQLSPLLRMIVSGDRILVLFDLILNISK